MLYNVRVVSMSFLGLDFYNFIPDALSEMNQIWIVPSLTIDADNFGSVCLMVCEKIDAPTNGVMKE